MKKVAYLLLASTAIIAGGFALTSCSSGCNSGGTPSTPTASGVS